MERTDRPLSRFPRRPAAGLVRVGAVPVTSLGAALSATVTAGRYSGSTVNVTTELVPGLLDPHGPL